MKHKLQIQSDMFFIYLFALCAHCIMFLVFLIYKIDIMTYINIFSILLYLNLILFGSNRDKRRIHISGIVLCTLEVLIHQIAAILCLGTDMGFQYFFIMLAIVVVLQSKDIVSKRIKVLTSLVIIAMLVMLELYDSIHEPIYLLPEYVKRTMLVVFTVVSVFGITFFSFNQWNVNEHYRKQIENLLGERNNRIYKMQKKIIRNFADIIEKRDGTTGGHIKRTSAYVEAIINALVENDKYTDVLTPEYSRMMISAAPLHDIGKISISDAILCKKGRLTDYEYDIMKTHSSIGGSMLKELLGNLESDEYINLAIDISKYHHEKWNGEGYPSQLKGEKIPLSARIMAVADVFDALTSVRSYKDSMTIDEAYAIMEQESGKHFDPIIISEFIRIKSHIQEIHTSLSK